MDLKGGFALMPLFTDTGRKWLNKALETHQGMAHGAAAIEMEEKKKRKDRGRERERGKERRKNEEAHL